MAQGTSLRQTQLEVRVTLTLLRRATRFVVLVVLPLASAIFMATPVSAEDGPFDVSWPWQQVSCDNPKLHTTFSVPADYGKDVEFAIGNGDENGPGASTLLHPGESGEMSWMFVYGEAVTLHGTIWTTDNPPVFLGYMGNSFLGNPLADCQPKVKVEKLCVAGDVCQVKVTNKNKFQITLRLQNGDAWGQVATLQPNESTVLTVPCKIDDTIKVVAVVPSTPTEVVKTIKTEEVCEVCASPSPSVSPSPSLSVSPSPSTGGETLPKTGVNVWVIVLMGFLLLGLGGALVALARVRRARTN